MPIRMAKIKNTVLSADEDVEQLVLLNLAGGDVKWYNHSKKQFGSFLEVKYTLTI